MKELLTRLAYKTSGFKSLFTAVVLALLVMHDFSPENAGVLTDLILAVLGAKAVQYMAEAAVKLKGKSNGED